MGNRFLKWLDNYWYHYKWRTIIVLFFTVLVIICVVQCSTVEKYDLTVFYAGPEQLMEEKCQNIGQVFSRCLKEDLDGNGEKAVYLRSFYILSPEQLAQKNEEAAKEGTTFYYTETMRTNAIRDFTITAGDGRALVMLIDPYLYGELRKQTADYFLPLSQLLEETPDNAVDEYSLRFCDLPLAQAYTALDILPEETLLCVMNPERIRGPWRLEEYDIARDFFRALVGFQVS